MAYFRANRVHVEVSSSGTADFSVGSAISSAYQSFAGASVPDGATFPYTAYTATQFECGMGEYDTAGPTVIRTAANIVAGSAGAGNKTNFSGNPRLFMGPLAEDFPVGKQAIPVPAGAMTPNTTNGAEAAALETATNDVMMVTMNFDATTAEAAQFSMIMPKSWDEGAISFQPVWSHDATTTNFGVVWELAAVAVSNDDAIDVAFGTGQTSTDTGGTTDDLYVGPESNPITIGGSPQAEDFVFFRVKRLPANASDTLAIDARLHAIRLFITTDLGNDD